MKKYSFIYIMVCSFLLFGGISQAQNIHFSQFYNAPIWLNPSLTGHIEGKYRANLNYKRQWTGITRSGVYNTPAISFDMNLRKRTNSRHSFGVGLGLVNDMSSSDNKLTHLTVLLGGAAHLNLDQNERHFISVGFNAGMSSRRLKTQEMLFASQYDGESLNPGVSSGEQFEQTSVINLDTRLGVTYSAYPSAKTQLKVGATLFHPVKMNESFLGLEADRPLNYLMHAEAKHAFTDKWAILPYFLYMGQAKTSEILLGTNLGIGLNDDYTLYVGGGYRVRDGMIAALGIQYNQFELGLSYDVNTTSLGGITNGRGDLELSFQYIGLSKKNEDPVLPALRYF